MQCPQENILVFDVEVCVSVGCFPVMATALTSKHWYSWTSKNLIDNSSNHDKLMNDAMIPLECGQKFKKLVIGHNVSFDRARVKEQYSIENSGAKFLDTMSMHVCVSGVTSYQRAMMKAKKELSEEDQLWGSLTSLNSLKEVYKLYCNKEETLDKEIRNIFMEGTLEDIRNDFQNLMTYCANDVVATNEVLKSLYPLFRDRFPHPATLAGMLELGSAYLPVNSNWTRYINEANLTYEDFDVESKTLLSQRADHACRLTHDEQYKNDLWMWDEDWSVQPFKLNKEKSKKNEIKETIEYSDDELGRLSSKFFPLMEKKKLIPARRPLLPGYPLWYRKL